jgi:hypothetical protein
VELRGPGAVWSLVGSPVTEFGDRFYRAVFDGTSGYGASGLELAPWNGFAALTVAVEAAPDFVALDGHGFVALASYGDGGPTVPEHHHWAVGIVVGSSVTYRVEYQDAAGTPQGFDLFTAPIPTGGKLAAVFVRERNSTGHCWTLYLDGALVAIVDQSRPNRICPTGLLGPLTIGYRSTLGVLGSGFVGTIENLRFDSEPWTATQVQMEARVTPLQVKSYDTVAQYHPIARGPGQRGVNVDRTSNYGKYRVRPFADAVGALRARLENFYAAALPPNCYGSQLERWERALDLPPVGTVAERQRRVLSRWQDTGTFTTADVQRLGATILGVDTSQVAVYQPPTRLQPVTTAGTVTPLHGNWHVTGAGDTDLTPTGIRLRSTSGTVLKSQEATLVCGHQEQILSGSARVREGGDFAATLVAASGTATGQWTGFVLAGMQAARYIGVYFDGAIWRLAYRDRVNRVLGSWTQLGICMPGSQLAMSWDKTAAAWIVRRFADPSDLTPEETHQLPALGGLSPVYRFGLCNGSEGALSGALEATWTGVTVQWPGSPTAYRYYVVSPTDGALSPVEPTAQLRARQRPTTQGYVTYEQDMLAETPGAMAEYTPLPLDPAHGPIPLGDDIAGAFRNLSQRSESLFTFQAGASRRQRDMIGPRYFAPGPAVTLATTTGPDTRQALTVAGVNAHAVADAETWARPSDEIVTFSMIIRINADGPIMQRQAGGLEITLRQLAGNLELIVDDGVTLETLQLANTSGDWQAVVFQVSDAGDVAVATSAGQDDDNFGLSTVTAATPWTLGSNSGSADFDIRWLAMGQGATALFPLPALAAQLEESF